MPVEGISTLPGRADLTQVGVNQSNQFVVHRGRSLGIAAADGLGGTVLEMILHQISGHAAQGFLHGGDLDDDVRAVAVILDHFLQAANLAFNSAEAFGVGFL